MPPHHDDALRAAWQAGNNFVRTQLRVRTSSSPAPGLWSRCNYSGCPSSARGCRGLKYIVLLLLRPSRPLENISKSCNIRYPLVNTYFQSLSPKKYQPQKCLWLLLPPSAALSAPCTSELIMSPCYVSLLAPIPIYPAIRRPRHGSELQCILLAIYAGLRGSICIFFSQ